MPDLNNMLISDISYNSDSIFNIASQILPRLKAIEYELIASKKQISAARGSISPNISVGGAIYTGYYKILTDTIEQASLSSQLKNNNSQAIYLSLNIPIFNNYTTGRNIRNAKIHKNDVALRLELEKK